MKKSRIMRFPNDAVLLVDADNWISTTIRIDLSDVIGKDLEQFLDLLSERAVGSDLLEDLSYQAIGINDGDICFRVRGSIRAMLEVGEVKKTTAVEVNIFAELGKQLGWTDFETSHALHSQGVQYEDECVIPLQNGRELRTDAFPHGCSYIRVTQNGVELAYWNTEEIQEDISETLGAILGCAHGGDLRVNDQEQPSAGNSLSI